ncbi:MAG TPA: histidine triad nucleotide-binding protein [bacterium]|nr:histidine triad nucleotide-binding protein [bacterium]
MEECIFCKIVAGELPTEPLYEDDVVVAFADVSPMAPVHALIVPKKHLANVDELSDEDAAVAGHMIMAAQRLARRLGVSASGYRLVINTGADATQIVPHLHVHLLGGRPLEPRLG